MMKLSPNAMTSLLTSLFPSEMIVDLARERDVVVRDRKLDVRVLVLASDGYEDGVVQRCSFQSVRVDS